MAGLFKAALVVAGIILLYLILSNLIRFALSLLSLLFPLLLVGLIAFMFYRLISRKCVSGSHRIFH